jgi:hypothetical protein
MTLNAIKASPKLLKVYILRIQYAISGHAYYPFT